MKVFNFNTNRINHNFYCGAHSGFPLCCIFFYTYIFDPIIDYNNQDCDVFSLHLEEKSIKGISSFMIENIKHFYRICNFNYFDGAYLGCPKCLIKNNYVKFKNCTNISHSHCNSNRRSIIKSFINGYCESIWLDASDNCIYFIYAEKKCLKELINELVYLTFFE